jgi:hypothetical protein
MGLKGAPMLLIYHGYKALLNGERPFVGHIKCLSEQQVSAFSKAAFHFVGIAFTVRNPSFTSTMEQSSPCPLCWATHQQASSLG